MASFLTPDSDGFHCLCSWVDKGVVPDLAFDILGEPLFAHSEGRHVLNLEAFVRTVELLQVALH